jgi:hypothetical protein
LDRELALLVSATRQPIVTEVVEAPPERSFAGLVRDAESMAADQWSVGGPRADNALWWSRWLAADPADSAAVAELARRRLAAISVAKAIRTPGDLPEGTTVEGDGAELLRSPAVGVVVALVHSGPGLPFTLTAATSGSLYLAGRRPAVLRAASPDREQRPDGPPGTLPYTERLGGRWVGFERRFEVLRELLLQGEKCLLPVEHPGQGEGTFFGRRVRTSTALARLALDTKAHLVVATCRRIGTRLVNHVSGDLADKHGESVTALHTAALAQAEAQLEGDPARLTASHFPAPEIADWLNRLAVLKRDRRRAVEAMSAHRMAVKDAAATFERLKVSGGDPRETRQARSRLTEARSGLRDARRAVSEAKSSLRAHPRPERAD